MNPKVGMYVRTEFNGIMKCNNIYLDGIKSRFENEEGNIYYFDEFVGVPSYEVIDLIEVGDIVITEYSQLKKTYIEHVSSLSVLEMFKCWTKEGTIKLRGILTKKQFENMVYKISDK